MNARFKRIAPEQDTDMDLYYLNAQLRPPCHFLLFIKVKENHKGKNVIILIEHLFNFALILFFNFAIDEFYHDLHIQKNTPLPRWIKHAVDRRKFSSEALLRLVGKIELRQIRNKKTN